MVQALRAREAGDLQSPHGLPAELPAPVRAVSRFRAGSEGSQVVPRAVGEAELHGKRGISARTAHPGISAIPWPRVDLQRLRRTNCDFGGGSPRFLSRFRQGRSPFFLP